MRLIFKRLDGWGRAVADTVLLVEDEKMQRMLMQQALENKLGYNTIVVENGESVIPALSRNPGIQIILLDLNLPDMDGFEIMERLKHAGYKIPVIILTGDSDIDQVVRAIKMGAVDFITKPTQVERLHASIGNALRIASLTHEVARLQREQSGTLHFDDLIGHDNGLKDAVRIGHKAAACDIPVLIHGETGVGKELMARAIHGESARSKRNFIAVNCGAIPENLVESTLFGHVRGAFTGAVTDAHGKFREADKGTLFLDEVGELPLASQVKLLRVLQQREVEPVGAGRTMPVDVRIISASNKNLMLEVNAGRFREDLFFRLNVLPITIPALRERSQDIVLLANYCIKQAVAQERLPARSLSPAARTVLEQYRWPGNVRELLNAVRRAMVLSDHATLETMDFVSLTQETGDTPPNAGASSLLSLLQHDGTLKSLDVIEHEAIKHALKKCLNNVTKAATSLGIAKSTFYKKLGDATE